MVCRGPTEVESLVGLRTSTGENPHGREPVSDERGTGDGDAWWPLGDVEILRRIRRTADLIDSVRREGPRLDGPEIARMRSVLVRPMTVARAVAESGIGPLGHDALIRLIADRTVRLREGWSLDDDAVVEPIALADGPPG